MLKIKDNIDLKELRNLNYRPKYNEDTGEIIKYIYESKNFKNETKIYVEITKEICCDGQYMYREYWQVRLIDLQGIDKVYDLIKADLVEKVEDK